MSDNTTQIESKSDWARVDAMTDDEIDTSDSPELDEKFFKNAKFWVPKDQRSITISVANEVLD